MSKYTNLAGCDKSQLLKFISQYDNFISDCDGVIWLGKTLIPNANHVINGLQKMGKRFFFLTNNNSIDLAQLERKFSSFGINTCADSVVSSALLASTHIKNVLPEGKRVYVIGSEGLKRELDKLNIPNFGVGLDPFIHEKTIQDQVQLESNVGMVLVGMDVHISYVKMIKAASYLKDPECQFVATNTDSTHPIDDIRLSVPGTGAMVASIQTGSDREPLIMGKPSLYASEQFFKEKGIDPKKTLMIGDRCDTDILFGNRSGYSTLLVLSGIHGLDDVARYSESTPEMGGNNYVPDYVINSLADFSAVIS